MDYDTPVEGLRALDRYTFQIRLKQPNYNFLYYLAYCNLTCALAREVVETYGEKTGEHPVGTGPYRLAFWKRSSKIVLEANPGFREQRFEGEPAEGDARAQAAHAANKGKRLPMVGKVEVYIVEESQPRWLAFLNASTTTSSASPTSSPTWRCPTTASRPISPSAASSSDRPARHGDHLLLLRDEGPGHRRLHAGEDRAAPRDDPGPGRGRRDPHRPQEPAIPAHSPIAPAPWAYDPDFHSTATEYNPAKSKALLEMYGYLDCDGDGYRDLPRKDAADECKPFSVEYASRPDGPQKPLDENWKKNMDDIGIRMTFKKAKWPDLLKESKAGKLQMWGLGWSAAIPDADAFFVMLYAPTKGRPTTRVSASRNSTASTSRPSGCPTGRSATRSTAR